MRLASRCAAIIAALGITVGGAVVPEAMAAPGNAVVFGDSLAANPTPMDYLLGKVSPGSAPRSSKAGCGSDNLFANAFAQGSGRAAANYTCAGASYRTGGMRISEQINRAVRGGDLNAGTAEVAIFAGANDTYPYILSATPLPIPEIQNNLRVAMVDAIRQVKAAAPQAKVKIVGLPSIGNAQGKVCLVNPGKNAGLPSALVDTRGAESAVQNAGRQASAETGAVYVDTRAFSAGHDMCSSDRWIAGIIDGGTQNNIAVHMTNHGLTQVGLNAGRA